MATEHISNLHRFRSNEVYCPSHAISDLFCDCGFIWIKNDRAFLITNKQTLIHTYIHHYLLLLLLLWFICHPPIKDVVLALAGLFEALFYLFLHCTARL